MPETISHSEVHAAWSRQQLSLFRAMPHIQQLDAVKANALEHWLEDARNEALDLLAGKKDNLRSPIKEQFAKSQKYKFEHPAHPLTSASVKSPILDVYIIDAMGGWLLAVAAVAIHFYFF